MRRNAVGTSDTSVASDRSTMAASKPAWTVSAGARVQRTGDDREPADVDEREARQPVVAGDRVSSRADEATRRRGDRVMREHDPFRCAGRTAGGDDERIAQPRSGCPPASDVSSRLASMMLLGRIASSSIAAG